MPACSTFGSAAGVLVGLGARRGHVDAQPRAVGAVGDDDGGAELLVRAHVPLEPRRQLRREGDAVALHGDVDVEARLARAEGRARRRRRGTRRARRRRRPGPGAAVVQAELAERARRGWRPPAPRGSRRGAAGDGAPRDDAEHVAERARSPSAGAVATTGSPADVVLRQARQADALERRVAPRTTRDPRRHHGLDRRVAEAVSRGALEVGESHPADEPARRRRPRRPPRPSRRQRSAASSTGVACVDRRRPRHEHVAGRRARARRRPARPRRRGRRDLARATGP